MHKRWVILVCSVVAMVGISNFQYAWTLFTMPLVSRLARPLAEIQIAFAIFMLGETWLVPLAGWLTDRFGPRWVVGFGGVAAGLGWVGVAAVPSLGGLYVFSGLSGLGCGMVYGAAMGTVLKWFPDRRGFCAGIVVAGSGGGTALTILPLAWTLDACGPLYTLAIWGAIQGALVVAAAMVLEAPPPGWLPDATTPSPEAVPWAPSRELSPTQVLRTRTFWLMYLMMALMAFTGLVANAQLAPFAAAYGVNQIHLWWGLTPLVVAIQLDRLMNAVSRPFWGWVSDRVGRPHAMFMAFGLQSLTLAFWIALIDQPFWFIILSGLAFFSWGEILSLFPAAVADLYGHAHASTNYGMLYTAKGVASIAAGPLAALFWQREGSWVPVLWAMVACSLVDALLARFLLLPVMRREMETALTESAD